jgi:hypothetical protein
MNAMLVYVMAAAGIFEGFLNGWYYDGTNNTLVIKNSTSPSSGFGARPRWTATADKYFARCRFTG